MSVSSNRRSASWKVNGFTSRIGIEYPIIQGPFGGRFSTPQLASAVSNAGGLGSFGAQPYLPEEMSGIVASIRTGTAKPFNMNLWVSNIDDGARDLSRPEYDRAVEALRPYFDEVGVSPPDLPFKPGPAYADQIAALIEAGPPVISFIFGVPSRQTLLECRRRGIVTIGTVTTADEARAVEAAGVDLVVASGCEAGGHRGSFLLSAEQSLTGTMSLVPQVVDAVKVPVIAAGGIADGRGIRAAMALGASGVQIGTAFLACEESNASPLHRRLLFGPEGRSTALTKSLSGRLARGIRNRFIEQTAASALAPLPYPAQGWLMRPVFEAAIAAGRWDLSGFWAGQGAGLLKHTAAAALMAALVGELEGSAKDA
jgi:nitronate monooxygenase